MQRIFYPESIVVIGVSDKPDNLAKNIVFNLRSFGFQGKLYAVGRRAGRVFDVEITDDLEKVPDGIDLAVILTPAAIVPQLIDTCGRKGIKRVVVESGGFSEFSPGGQALEEQLLEIIQRWDMRMVGPNCISVVNLENGVCLPFTPLPKKYSRFGKASIIAQSGGVSINLMGMLSHAGVGANKVISIGNKADLDENDYLRYLLADPGTKLVCMYLESIEEGRALMQQARQAAKPILIHKANRGQASQSVAFSHTAALANDDRIVDAALRQANIMRAEDFHDLTAMAQGFLLPPVEGPDLLILSRSGGHAVTAADLAQKHGFKLPPLPDSFVQMVQSFFRADVIKLTNPLDLGVIFDFPVYAQIVEASLHALSPDAVLLINTYSYTEADGAHRLAQRVSELMREQGKPIAFCVYADTADPQALQDETQMPVFDDLDAALRALACSRDWHAGRTSAASLPDFHDPELPPRAPSPLPAAPLNPEAALDLCQRSGIPVPSWAIADNPEQAAQAALEIGLPVALKLNDPTQTHKSDVGGVALSLSDANDVRKAAQEMQARHGHKQQLLIQRMAPKGIELILGCKRDPSFGPVVMIGLGGIFVEIYDDVSFRVAPLDPSEAAAMIDELRGSSLLAGLRGQPAADRKAIVRAILQMAQMMLEQPGLLEMEINPLIAASDGVHAVDVRAQTRPCVD